MRQAKLTLARARRPKPMSIENQTEAAEVRLGFNVDYAGRVLLMVK